MAFIRFITRDYKIVGEKNVNEIPNEEYDKKMEEYLSEYPRADVALYWTDDDLKKGYDHPYQFPTKKYLDYLISIGRY